MARPPQLGVKSIQRIGRVVQEVEGAPQQSSHRRGRYPIAGGSKAKVAYIVEDVDGETGGDNTWFARNAVNFEDGTPRTIKCSFKTDSSNPFDVQMSYASGVYFTGQPVTIVTIGGEWEITQGGQHQWVCRAAEDSDDGPRVFIPITNMCLDGTGFVQQYAVANATLFDSQESYTINSILLVEFVPTTFALGGGNQFQVVKILCPEIVDP